MASALDVITALGVMNRDESVGERHQVMLATHYRRNRVIVIVDVQSIQHGVYRASDTPTRHRSRGRVNGYQRSCEGGDGIGVNLTIVINRQHHRVGLRQLPGTPKLPHFAGEQATSARRHLFDPPRLVEEGQGQPRLPVGDDHFRESAPALAHRLVGGFDHLSHDRDVLIQHEPRNIGQLTAFSESPWVVA